MKNWIKVYQKEYKPLLNVNANGGKRGVDGRLYNRAEGYELIFKYLLESKNENFQIIETGTVRNPNNWKDGNSGFLFSEFVKNYGGFVRSVDIDPTAVEAANSFIDNNYYRSHCSDSVTWLSSQDDLSTVDLFYLDSWDVEWANDEPSASHHLKEFKAIEPFLRVGSIVAIDDNAIKLDRTRTGKGRMIVEYLSEKNIDPVYDQYQIIYRF